MRKLVISHKLTNRDSESFRQYLFEISNIDVFSSEEEFECATKSAAGDLKAREELIKRNLRFVVSVAKQYSNSVNHIEDLINEGNRGVIKAANHFDPTTGHKFITFAVWWIRKYITEYMEKHAKLVRLPANKVYGLSKLNRNIDLLEQKLGRTPDVSEIIEFCGSKDDGVDIRNLETINSVRFDSLDREVSFGNEGSITLGEMITNENSQSADHIVTSQGDSSDIKRFLTILKPSHQKIIIGFFGLDGGFSKTLDQLSEELDLTREMVRQIKNKSLIKLKEAMINSSVRC